MTEGSISKKLILFALPVFLGQLLQQLYNVVDTIVVGNYLGKEALAAVSSSGSLIFLIVGFVNGLFMGAGVIIGNRYGAKDYESVHTATHTAVGFGLICGIIMTLIGVFFAPVILRLMGTPGDVLPSSVSYLQTYFIGSLANVMYNTCCGIFQAVGDSRHPLYYLIVSAITNIFLDILLVTVFPLGIKGVAIATVISQFLSAALAFAKLLRTDGPHKIVLKDIRINMSVLIKELKIGIPTGIQNSVIAIANVIVQSNINAFGSIAMAGSGSYFKLEGFAFLPIHSVCSALTTFTSQNLGAGKYDRIRRIFLCCLAAVLLIGLPRSDVRRGYRYPSFYIRTFLHRVVYQRPRCNRIRNRSITYRVPVLLHVIVFALYRIRLKRCRKDYRSDVCHARLLVRFQNNVHYHSREILPGYRNGLQSLSHHVVIKLNHFHYLLFEIFFIQK